MIKQAFQHAELRDANDNIIQQGAYGKKSDLANATNDGWIDFVMNNLEALYAALGDDPNFANTIATLIDTKCAQAKAEAMLAAHPVGSFYESTDPTSPATLFGGTWQEQIPDGELIGTVAAFAGKILPTGWLLCDGSAVDRTLYSALFSVIGTSYGAGDGSTTFHLPNLIDKFIQGNATAGTEHSAGLPNITGSFKTRPWGSGNVHSAVIGAFQSENVSSAPGTIATGSIGDHLQNITLNASRGSSIYGNSNTVQPPALTMRFAIYSGAISKKLWLRTA